MRSLYAKRPPTPNNPRTFTVAALTILGLLTLVFASFEAGTTIRDLVVGVAYFCGASLATFALCRAALGAGGRERLLWTLLAGGLLLRFAGDLVWLLAWGVASGYVLPHLQPRTRYYRPTSLREEVAFIPRSPAP